MKEDHTCYRTGFIIPPLVIIIFASLVILIGAHFYLDSKRTLQSHPTPTPTQGPSPKAPVSIPTSTPTPKQKQWILKRVSGNEEKEVFNLLEKDAQILKWQDYLFYAESKFDPKEGDVINILNHNLKTGETTLQYQQHNGNTYNLKDFQIINNTLFFSFGGFIGGQTNYWLDLPPAGKPQKLEGSSLGGSIKYMKNRYWLISCGGDGPGSSCSYSLFDINTKKATFITQSVYGISGGNEEFIAIDKRNRMLLAGRKSQDNVGISDTSAYGSWVILNYVLGITLSNPSSKEGIIAEQNMPKSIIQIKYSEDKDIIYLISTASMFAFNFSSGQITKIESGTKPLAG